MPKKTNRKKVTLLCKMIREIAPEIGAKLHLEPEWNTVGQITFKNGIKKYFRYNTLDINTKGSSEIASDKDYTNFFLKSMGYPTVPGSKAFYSDEWADTIGSEHRKIDEAYKYATGLGFPVIVKPNSGSQGKDVSFVNNKTEFFESVRNIFKSDRIVLVQKIVTGKDYRIVVLDNRIIAVYQRIPLNVIGNGKSSITKLFNEKMKTLEKLGRKRKINIDDNRIKLALKHQQKDQRYIPKVNEVVYLLCNANLSTGGDVIDVTDKIHPYFKKQAIDITRDMGLRLCGVDLMIDGDISTKTDKYTVIEINSNPSFLNYYSIGKSQKEKIRNMYKEILIKIENCKN